MRRCKLLIVIDVRGKTGMIFLKFIFWTDIKLFELQFVVES